MIKQSDGNEFTFSRLLALIIGSITVLIGLSFLFDPSWETIYGVQVDLTSVKHPLSTITVGVGIYACWLAFIPRRKDGNDTVICPQCEDVMLRKESHNSHCPQCKVELELLDGFYERHPELKDK